MKHRQPPGQPPPGQPRKIVGFHLDENLDWVAELECGHQQHVRSEDQAAAEADEHQADVADGVYAQQTTPISPELKEAIAEELKEQLAYENAAAAKPEEAATLDSLPQVMVPDHLFVVDQPFTVATADQDTCNLSAGDVLRLAGQPPDGSQTAELTVAGSRQLECPAGAQVIVALQDLQDMHDSFRARLNTGLQQLHDNQGQNGLPAAPKSAMAPPPRPALDVPADTTDVDAALTAAQREADQAQSQSVEMAFAVVAPN